MSDYSQIIMIVLIILIVIICIGIGFFLCVLIGNLTAMKMLARMGVAVFSNKIETDSKLLDYINKDGISWLKIPDICYSPIMLYKEGFYKNHNYLKKDNLFGELYLSEDIKAIKLLDIGIDIEDRIKDLSIIKGNYRGIGTSLRKANFSLLRKIKDKIRDNSVVQLCENGKVRYFKPIAIIDKGLNENHSFKFKNRKEFIDCFLSYSKVTSDNINRNKPMLILECKTDIDIVMVLLEEMELKKNE